MSVLLIHPSIQDFRSGGNGYNAMILRHARRNNFSIDSLSVNKHQRLQEKLPEVDFNSYRLVIVDSYFISDLHQVKGWSKWPHLVLLLHHLPSENLALSAQQRRLESARETPVMAKAERFIVTGIGFAQKLRLRFPQKKICVCEPGIDVSIFRRSVARSNRMRHRPTQLLSIGNFTPQKGYLVLLTLLSNLSEQKWRWNIVGDESFDPALVTKFGQESRRLGIDERITRNRSLSLLQVARKLHESDIFVSASYYETYGMALAEAVAMRVPALATRVGDAARLIQHGETGYVVELGDWAAFECYLSRMIESSALRRKFRTAHHARPRAWEQTFADFAVACCE